MLEETVRLSLSLSRGADLARPRSYAPKYISRLRIDRLPAATIRGARMAERLSARA